MPHLVRGSCFGSRVLRGRSVSGRAAGGPAGDTDEYPVRAGSRPTAVKQTKCGGCHLFAATCPGTQITSTLLAPTVNTHDMSRHLTFIAEEAREKAGQDVHVVLVLDVAGLLNISG